jgi:hypothetical protein
MRVLRRGAPAGHRVRRGRGAVRPGWQGAPHADLAAAARRDAMIAVAPGLGRS